jgi:NAD+-processing family protein with receiver domain
MIKLWHDDIREAPDASWTVARTNEQALTILRTLPVIECSLDHDLGLEENGLQLAQTMAEEKLFPARINIHSWNYWGSEAMAQVLREAGAPVVTREEARSL